MRRRAALLLTAGLLAAGAAAGQGDPPLVHCAGDSLTEGPLPFDEEGIGGYPTRLQPLLRQGGLENAQVVNFGVGGDDTFDTVAKVGTFVPNADILVLLIGTNDINDIVEGRYLLSDTIRNIDIMLDFAEASGVETVVGTLPPRKPRARSDRDNSTTYEVIQEIRQMAHLQRRQVADFFHLFPYRERSTYALYYHPGGEDVIGHPNAAGFQKMAELVAGVILDGDNQSPVDGRLRQPGMVDQVNAETDYELEMFDFDSGIQLSSARLLINGEPVETMITGNRRKAVLFSPADGRGRCKVVLTVRANDFAEPPNEVDLLVDIFATPRELISGDANGDCRVDGRDLAIFGPAFGKARTDLGYDQELDFVVSGLIDGEDLARLAGNFGRGSLPQGAN